MKCKFFKHGDLFIVDIHINDSYRRIGVNIDDYFNYKTESAVQRPRQPNVDQQQSIPGASSVRYYSPNYVPQRMHL
jgi:peptidoglycan hydrolase-like protein with peptidoglycan-binding domain